MNEKSQICSHLNGNYITCLEFDESLNDGRSLVWFGNETYFGDTHSVAICKQNRYYSYEKKRKGLDVYIVHVCKLSGGYIIYAKQLP